MHSGRADITVLVGAPNSGKTTLFNWLTGAKFRAVNYPGATVDCFLGETHSRYGQSISVMDTPGTYSLFPKSPDEEITRKALFEAKGGPPSRVVVVADATQLGRHIGIAKQIHECGFEVIVALTMSDLLRAEGHQLNVELLEKALGIQFVFIDGSLGGGVQDLVDKIRELKLKAQGKKIDSQSLSLKKPTEKTKAERESEFKNMQELVQAALNPSTPAAVSGRPDQLTDQLDRVLLHPVMGIVSFFSIMFMLFAAIFWLAAPFMDWVDVAFSQLAQWVEVGVFPVLVSDFLANGLIAGFAAVFIFVPQIFILFFIIGLLEDSGYLARAATLVDRPLAGLGMNGKSFVPLLSGFACAVPAMMATRTMGSVRERWITMLIIPFMTCSARLPVYALLLSFLFAGQAAWKPALVLAGLYFAGLFVGTVVAKIVHLFLNRAGNSFFMMDLPIYRRPKIRVVVKNSLQRTKSYIYRAGPLIFLFSILIWIFTTFPNYQAEPQERLQSSYMGVVGQAIEPAFEPMDLDWRAGVSLLTAFAAREVFVSSLAVVLSSTTEGDDDSLQGALLLRMAEARKADGTPLFTLASIAGLLVFFVIALQCLSTTAMAYKEMKSWPFAIFQLILFNLLAYAAAVFTVQILN